MAQIYVTRNIPDAGIQKLQEQGYDVDVSEKDGVLTKEELISALQQKDYDAVLCLLTDTIDADVLDAAPNAKIFANYAVGFDNIDRAAARERGVVVSNTPEVLTDTVVEHTLALMLATGHRIVEGDKFVRAGKYEGWAPMLLLGNDLSGKTLGIIGLGRIGAQVAYRAARGFGAHILYYDIERDTDFEEKCGAEYVETLEDLLPRADFVSLHVPLVPETKHLLNKERLSLMKESAYLINTSRGPVIDEAALVEALQAGTIRGAALDVFENEPELTPGLSELSNVVLTPHLGSATEETRAAMSERAADNITAVLEGNDAPDAVEK